MLIKVLLISISCCLTYVQVTEVKQLRNGAISVLFNISKPSSCMEEKRINLKEGDQMTFSVASHVYVNMGTCMNDQFLLVNMTNHQEQNFTQNSNVVIIFPVVNISKGYEGMWECTFYILQGLGGPGAVDKDGKKYTSVHCFVNVTVGRTSTENKAASSQVHSNEWIYIVGVLGVLFLAIIIIQFGLLYYYKRKAKRTAGLETLSMKFRNSEGRDHKRYSATPGSGRRRPLTFARFLNRSSNKDESIYETLEEIQASQLPPTPPIETIPTLKKNKTDTDMSNRPPLPLPEESYEEPMNIIEREPTKLPVSVISDKSEELKLAAPLQPEVKQNRVLPSSSAQATLGPSKTKPTPKFKPGNSLTPAPVISELDTIFKRRQNGSTAGSPSPKKSPQGVEGKEKRSFFSNKSNPQNRAASLAPAPAPVPKGPWPVSKMSLPDIKQGTLTKKPDPAKKPATLGKPKVPVTSQPVVPTKPLPTRSSTMTNPVSLEKPAPVPAQTRPGPITPLQSIQQESPKPSIPPLPQLNQFQAPPSSKPKMPSPIEVQAPPLPVAHMAAPLPPPNQIQEPVYEEYEEEPIYNSDEDWTYEALPPMNIYSS